MATLQKLVLWARVDRFLSARDWIKSQSSMESSSRFFKCFFATQSSPPVRQRSAASLPHFQEYCRPNQVEDSKQHILVIVLPVKEVVRDTNEGHGYQGKREILQKSKVECQTLTKVMSDVIYIMKDTKGTSLINVAKCTVISMCVLNVQKCQTPELVYFFKMVQVQICFTFALNELSTLLWIPTIVQENSYNITHTHQIWHSAVLI